MTSQRPCTLAVGTVGILECMNHGTESLLILRRVDGTWYACCLRDAPNYTSTVDLTDIPRDDATPSEPIPADTAYTPPAGGIWQCGGCGSRFETLAAINEHLGGNDICPLEGHASDTPATPDVLL